MRTMGKQLKCLASELMYSHWDSWSTHFAWKREGENLDMKKAPLLRRAALKLVLWQFLFLQMITTQWVVWSQKKWIGSLLEPEIILVTVCVQDSVGPFHFIKLWLSKHCQLPGKLVFKFISTNMKRERERKMHVKGKDCPPLHMANFKVWS